ncbi:hypothetical protein Poly30_09810 [Planctomycetes bacterium Poly30]|uniref:Uncharacterized protein n=1 Tax=Saltatorellus ferox TaxID=2528018 RepID=A0A518EN19_9BACT|nr:hypothetical protein Poly30_09810 [Planctomycetes bacterium Poly30]
MMVTDELFDHRGALLRASFEAAGAPYVLVEAWLRIDEAHRGAIVKGHVSECRPRWRNDPILDFPEPGSRRSAG